ncbi:anaphase-promoting complex subunit 5 [Cimex lectularius]|uniref:Anaphase-promoting complex subunit 5 n=1 Tax=Cimex lectularius TaxID=79782 RepID=A0A8I6R9Q9_CIMLE|nr:anaphase-promoting complex subunit 5 [Cimex lectularius]
MSTFENGTHNDIWNFKGVNKNSMLEYVTPYKISIVILINELCQLKTKNMCGQLKRVLFPQEQKPIYRRDFCMLILMLIQAPDMDYQEFVRILESGKYCLEPDLVENFKRETHNLLQRDVGCIMDVLNSVEKFPLEPNTYETLINRGSKIGLFLRRVKLFFEKLSFSQTVGMYKAYQSYVLNSRSVNLDHNMKAEDVTELDESECKHFGDRISMEMDLSSICEELVQPISPRASSEQSCCSFDEVEKNDPPIGLWSRRQAELFIAQQAKLLVNNPEQAMPPPQLQAKLRDVIATNPEHAEAHFLSYMNCTRVKEYCGAVDSLYHYFDRKAPSSYEDEAVRCKGLRFAALNLAILQAKFNHRDEALFALKEAITLAHEANDNVCLQHAQAWMYKLQNDEKDVLMERSISNCDDLNLNYLSSFGLQSYAEHLAKQGTQPSKVFELLSKSDIRNYQYSMMDLLSSGFAIRSALWNMYGKCELAVLSVQQLLHLDTSTQGISEYTAGDALILAISNLVNYFALQGEYQIAWSLVNHGKDRVPGSKWWLWSENVLYFIESLHKGQWQHAHLAITQLATVDELESLLRLCELLLVKGNRQEALECANKVHSMTKNPVMRIRALLFAAKANPKGSIMKLCDALSIASHHSIDYWTGLIALEISNIQHDMGMSCQALKLVERTLLVVLSNGCYSDMSDCLVIFAKCKVSSVANSPFPVRLDVIQESIRILSKAAELAKQIENYSKVKRIVYLQALLSHNIGMFTERNKYAFEFRILDEQFPTNDSPSS